MTTQPGMIPEMVWAAHKDTGAGTAFGCLHCLLAGLEPPDERRFMYRGTVLCATHTLASLAPGETQ